jgi:hypothetical protein
MQNEEKHLFPDSLGNPQASRGILPKEDFQRSFPCGLDEASPPDGPYKQKMPSHGRHLFVLIYISYRSLFDKYQPSVLYASGVPYLDDIGAICKRFIQVE